MSSEIIGNMEIRIIGSRVGSPYPSRRKLEVAYSVPFKNIRQLPLLYSHKESFDEYVKFCRFLSGEGDKCLRHRCVEELPIWESNYEQFFSIERGEDLHLQGEVGQNRWRFDVVIPYMRSGITDVVITRPSGKVFAYRAESGWTVGLGLKLSSAYFILARIFRYLSQFLIVPNLALLERFGQIRYTSPTDSFVIPPIPSDP